MSFQEVHSAGQAVILGQLCKDIFSHTLKRNTLFPTNVCPHWLDLDRPFPIKSLAIRRSTKLYEVQKRRATDIEALKLLKVWSGSSGRMLTGLKNNATLRAAAKVEGNRV